MEFMKALENRRSHYAIGREVSISNETVSEIVREALGSLTLYPIRICSKALQQAYFFVKF